MSPVGIELVIGIATFVLSGVTAAFISGRKVGNAEARLGKLEEQQTDFKALLGVPYELRTMNDRLARIEGAFTMVPNPPPHA